MSELITLKSEELNQLYKSDAYTITGAGGDLKKWMDGYNEILQKDDIGKVEEFFTFKGGDMNKKYHLTGDNAYPKDLTFLAFKLNGLNTGKLAMFKLKMEDRWFKDIVDNNKYREQESKKRNKMNLK